MLQLPGRGCVLSKECAVSRHSLLSGLLHWPKPGLCQCWLHTLYQHGDTHLQRPLLLDTTRQLRGDFLQAAWQGRCLCLTLGCGTGAGGLETEWTRSESADIGL